MKFLLVSPLGHHDEWLGPFIGPLQALGHEVVDDTHPADVAMLSLRWGKQGYTSALDNAIRRRIPVVAIDWMDYVVFTGGSEWFEWGLSPHFARLGEHPTYWNMPWALALRAVSEAGLLRVYFQRYMQKSQEYPPWVRPIEQAMYPGSEFPLDPDVGSRPFDLCFIGMASQPRATLLCSLIESRMFKIDWEFPFVRLDWHPWVARQKRARMFLEINGGGQGSDRPYQLIRAAPMLKQRSDRRWVKDWTDKVNCLEIADVRGVPQPGDLQILRAWLDSPVALQKMYERGAAFAEETLSPLARTRYVLYVLGTFGVP